MFGFKNVNAYIDGKGIVRTDIAIENGKIVKIGDNLDIENPFTVSCDCVVLPGFIDQHIHGVSNSDCMDGDISSLKNIAISLASEGTTSFLATTMTQKTQDIITALENIDKYIKLQYPNGANVLGVHLEGPFISEKHTGAQPLKYLKEPSLELFESFRKASGDNIKMVTLAIEEVGANQLIKHIVSSGAVASVGHSDAGYNYVIESMKNGLTCVTHTFNAQRGIHHRELGIAGAGLLNDELYCEIICDLVHLSVPTLKLIVKTKPKDKIIIITDGMRAKNTIDSQSQLGGQKVVVKDGVARLENGTLAGSVSKMNDAIKNLVLSAGVNFLDAVDYATINPAKNLNLSHKIGSIKVGKNADFAVLDGNFNVLLTVRDGMQIYKK